MNKRQLKKRNTKYIKSILDMIPFKKERIAFGSGYFIFEMNQNSIAWFWLKAFPEWKFGIWLNQDDYREYEIFGQRISMIDKFKPSRSELCEDYVHDFNMELFNIIGKHPKWKEYLDEADNEDEYQKKTDIQNRVIYQSIFEFIRHWNKEQVSLPDEDQVLLELVDGNSKSMSISPRYRVYSSFITRNNEFIASEQKHFELDWNVYLKLCEHIGKFYTDEALEEFYIDDYIFKSFSQTVESKQSWERKAKRYNWEQKDYGIHLQELYDYNRKDYEINEVELEKILQNWFDNNYCDSHTIDGFASTLDRIYHGQYNVQYAEMLIRQMFRKAERMKS